MLCAVLLCCAAIFFSASQSPATQKRIYIAPDDHTDYMWAANESVYEAAMVDMIDYYLDLANSTAGNPSDYQSRFNMDCALYAWNYEKNNPSRFPEFIERLRDGHMSMLMNTVTTIYGAMPAEAVLRTMYYAGTLERRHNLRFPLAGQMEDQTLCYGLGSLFTGAGALYTWKGVCACATYVPDSGNRAHPVYWWAGPDGSRILMKWYPLQYYSNMRLGGYAECWDPTTGMNDAANLAGSVSHPYLVAGAFGRGWDNVETFDSTFPAVAQGGTNADRRVIVSNMTDYFQDMEAAYGASLPEVAETTGNEWDLAPTTLPEVSARVKRAVEKLRSAEALAVLAALKDPSFRSGQAYNDARARANINLGLFWEHCWMGGPGVSDSARDTWQRRVATDIEGYVNGLFSDASAALGAQIARSGGDPRFFVFNPLSWTRTDAADYPYAGALPVHVVDLATGQETPSQIVTIGGAQYLRIHAQAVPPVGYKVFEIRPGAGTSFADAAAVAGGVIENAYFRVTINDKGALTSLMDKTRGNREFVGAGKKLNDLSSTGGIAGSALDPVAAENAGAVSATLVAHHSGPHAHYTRVTLFRNSPRVEVKNEIAQNVGDNRLTWNHELNLSSPDARTEEVGAVIRLKKKSQGGHYSDTTGNCRYDWSTLNHFADMSGGGVGLTLSNSDCYAMKLGASTIGTLDTATPSFSVLARGRLADFGEGLPNNPTDTYALQRFALTTHDAYDQTSAMKFALEHQNPLVTGAVTGGDDYPETDFSLLTISDPDVLLWALKPSEEGIGDGVIARVWNQDSSATAFSLVFNPGLASAVNTTHIETDLSAATVGGGALTDTANGNQLKTYRLFPSDSSPTPTPTATPTPAAIRVNFQPSAYATPYGYMKDWGQGVGQDEDPEHAFGWLP